MSRGLKPRSRAARASARTSDAAKAMCCGRIASSLGAGGHQVEGDSDDAVGAAKDLAAHEAHRCGHLHRCLRAQVEHRVEEEDRCIEVLPRLSEVDVIDTFDHVRVIVFGGAELAHPSRLRSSLGTEEHLRTVGRSNTHEGLLARALLPRNLGREEVRRPPQCGGGITHREADARHRRLQVAPSPGAPSTIRAAPCDHSSTFFVRCSPWERKPSCIEQASAARAARSVRNST